MERGSRVSIKGRLLKGLYSAMSVERDPLFSWMKRQTKSCCSRKVMR